MKKLLALLLTGAMVFSVAACGGSDAPADDANAEARRFSGHPIRNIPSLSPPRP